MEIAELVADADCAVVVVVVQLTEKKNFFLTVFLFCCLWVEVMLAPLNHKLIKLGACQGIGILLLLTESHYK